MYVSELVVITILELEMFDYAKRTVTIWSFGLTVLASFVVIFVKYIVKIIPVCIITKQHLCQTQADMFILFILTSKWVVY